MNIYLKVTQLVIQVHPKKTLRPLNFTLQPGECLGILGENGSGKTSLLHTLAALRKIKNGGIDVNDRPLFSLSKIERAKYLGILLQHFNFVLPQTIEACCAMGRYPYTNFLGHETRKDREIIQHVLEIVGLWHLRFQKVNQLSGGEQQRLQIAILLAQMPSIYLLDEPTNHLDIPYQIKILSHFKYLAKKQGNIIIMAMHDFNLAAQLCDSILMIHQNGTHIYGPVQTLMTEAHLSHLYQHPIQAKKRFSPMM